MPTYSSRNDTTNNDREQWIVFMQAAGGGVAVSSKTAALAMAEGLNVKEALAMKTKEDADTLADFLKKKSTAEDIFAFQQMVKIQQEIKGEEAPLTFKEASDWFERMRKHVVDNNLLDESLNQDSDPPLNPFSPGNR